MSSEGIREFAKNSRNNSHLFNCILCKQPESVIRPHTRKIILTDSTLYNVWTYANLTTSDHHMEIESVVGARIRNLTRVIMMLYLKHPERLEIIIIAGINNVGEGQAVHEILDEIYELKEAVMAHSTMHDHNPPSMVSVSTVMYAPKFCSLDVPVNKPDWPPSQQGLSTRGGTSSVSTQPLLLRTKAMGLITSIYTWRVSG